MNVPDRTDAGGGNDRPLMPLASPPFVGRGTELTELIRMLEAPPSLSVVAGESGMGKTRLVQEALGGAEQSGALVLTGQCHPVEQPFPAGAVVDALRTLPNHHLQGLSGVGGVLRSLLPEFARLLPEPPPPLDDRAAERHRLFRALREVVEQAAPNVLVLEDLHWADRSTIEFIGFLLADMPNETALVLTYRPEDLPPDTHLRARTARVSSGVQRLNLELMPLPKREAEEFVLRMLGVEGASEAFLSYLYEKTAGIPFALEEMIRLLADRRDLVHREGRWARRALDEMRVPGAIRDWILARASLLGTRERAVLEAAAVLGRGSDAASLQVVAGLADAEFDEAFDRSLSSGLLVEEGNRARIRHDLARQALYGAIPAARRRRLHGRAAERCIAASAPTADIAHHYKEARIVDKWVRYGEAAAHEALAVHEDATASRLLEEALSAAGLDDETRGRLAGLLGEAALQGLAHDEAIKVLDRILVDEPLADERRGELHLYLGLLKSQAGDASAGMAELRRALPFLEERGDLSARARSMLAVPWVEEGDVDEHRTWLEEARQLADQIEDPVMRLRVAANRAGTLLLLADPSGWDALEDLPRPQSAGEWRQWMRAHINAAQAALHLGDYRGARRELDRAALAAENVPYERVESGFRSTTLLLDWFMGRWGGLARTARKLLDEGTGVAHADIDVWTVLAQLLVARGETDEALPILADVMERARRSGSIPLLMAAAAARGRVALDGGQPEEAWTILADTLDLVRRKRMWWWGSDAAPIAVEALIALNRADAAADLVEEFTRGVERIYAPLAAAASLTIRGLEAGSETARLLGDAERAWGELPRPYDAARVREKRGIHLLSTGAAGAEEMLFSAMASFSELGALADLARVRRVLRAHGIKVPHPWRGGRRGYGDRLSPRESEVADLAATGLTNREIAQRLFLSPKTVENQMRSALRKLGLSSRRDLRHR